MHFEEFSDGQIWIAEYRVQLPFCPIQARMSIIRLDASPGWYHEPFGAGGCVRAHHSTVSVKNDINRPLGRQVVGGGGLFHAAGDLGATRDLITH